MRPNHAVQKPRHVDFARQGQTKPQKRMLVPVKYSWVTDLEDLLGHSARWPSGPSGPMKRRACS